MIEAISVAQDIAKEKGYKENNNLAIKRSSAKRKKEVTKMEQIDVIKGIILAPKEEELRILLLLRSKESKKNPGLWDLPGGKIETQKTSDQKHVINQIKDELKREVREETHICLNSQQVVGFFPVQLKTEDAYITIDLCLVLMGSTETLKLNYENDDAQWLSLKHFKDMPPQTLAPITRIIHHDIAVYINVMAPFLETL